MNKYNNYNNLLCRDREREGEGERQKRNGAERGRWKEGEERKREGDIKTKRRLFIDDLKTLMM